MTNLIEKCRVVEARLRQFVGGAIAEKDADTIRDLVDALEAAEKDAASWRAYQERKQAAIKAGLGRNPLRSQAIDTDMGATK